MAKKPSGKGILLGLLAGGIYTLLNAPRSGRETRARLEEYLQKQKDNFQSYAEEQKINFIDFQAKKDHLTQSIDRLNREGMKALKGNLESINNRVEGFEAEIQPRINRIKAKLTDIQAHTNESE